MAATKLLLLEDVEHLGRSGEIVSVKPGYARNKLLPSSVAVLADKKALRMQIRLQEQRAKRAAEEKAEAEALKAKLEAIEAITAIVKVDQEGHMYGSVTVQDILDLLQAQTSVELEKRMIQLKHPIKKLGVFAINVRLKEGVTADVQLHVTDGSEPVVSKEKEAE